MDKYCNDNKSKYDINDVTSLGGEGGSAKSLFSKMGDKGEGRVENLKKLVTSSMNGHYRHPKIALWNEFSNA